MSMSEKPVTIILIEDDPGHATLIERNLVRAGISNPIQKFKDGQSAMSFFNSFIGQDDESRYLVLLDLNLPIIDGFEVLEHLKKNEYTRNIPVVILTTTDNPREIDRCYALGCNIYLVKPINYEQFCEAIRKLGLALAVIKVPHHDATVVTKT